MQTIEITGHEAIRIAETRGTALRAHADPTGAADREVTIDEAREIASEDPGLVYSIDPLGSFIDGAGAAYI